MKCYEMKFKTRFLENRKVNTIMKKYFLAGISFVCLFGCGHFNSYVGKSIPVNDQNSQMEIVSTVERKAYSDLVYDYIIASASYDSAVEELADAQNAYDELVENDSADVLESEHVKALLGSKLAALKIADANLHSIQSEYDRYVMDIDDIFDELDISVNCDEYDSLKQTFAEALVSHKSAIAVKEEKALLLASAEKEYNEAVENQIASEVALETAKQALDTAVTDYDTAKKEYELACAELASAKKNRDDAQAKSDLAKQNVDNRKQELEEAKELLCEAEESVSHSAETISKAKEAVAASQKAVDDAQAVIDRGVLGFYEAQGADEAVKIINAATSDALPEEWRTVLGASNSATSLENVKETFKYIRETNKKRTTDDNFPGLDELLVSYNMMALSEANAKIDMALRDHAGLRFAYTVNNKDWTLDGEVLQFVGGLRNSDYSDVSSPVLDWYDVEKVNYDTNNHKTTGHYRAIVNSKYVIAGFAISLSDKGNVVEYNQNFRKSYLKNDTVMTVDEYEQLFLGYYTGVMNNLTRAQETLAEKQKELDALLENNGASPEEIKEIEEAKETVRLATEALETSQTILYEANISLSDTETALDNAMRIIEEKNTELANAEKNLSDASSAYDSAVSETDKAIDIVQKKEAEKTLIQNELRSADSVIEETEVAVDTASEALQDYAENSISHTDSPAIEPAPSVQEPEPVYNPEPSSAESVISETPQSDEYIPETDYEPESYGESIEDFSSESEAETKDAFKYAELHSEKLCIQIDTYTSACGYSYY